MKTEEGIIIETDGPIAKVKAGRHTECKDCGACPGSDAAIVTVRNPVNAQIGQRVQFEVKDEGSLKGAFLIFFFPLIALFIGIFLGGTAAGLISVSVLAGRIIGAVVFFAVSVIIIRLYDRRVGLNKGSLPAIVRII